MIYNRLTVFFKNIKKKFSSLKPESEISFATETLVENSEKDEQDPIPSQSKNKADVLTFDTKRRIFVLKKRHHSVAVYDPKNYAISSIKTDEKPQTINFVKTLTEHCLPFSGNWFHAEQTDMGLYCTKKGEFILYNSENKTLQTIKNKFHHVQHKIEPITGDWLGNGKKSIGVFDNTIATFFIKTTAKEDTEDKVFSFGSEHYEGIPLVGDWNGDGKETIGLYLAKQGVFFLHNSLEGCEKADMNFHFGPENARMIPLVGDWNGDGKDTIGLYSPEQGLFFLHNKNEGTENLDYAFHFGPTKSNIIPIVGDWNGEGKSGVGVFDPDTLTFYLSQNLTGGSAEMKFKFKDKNLGSIPFIFGYVA